MPNARKHKQKHTQNHSVCVCLIDMLHIFGVVSAMANISTVVVWRAWASRGSQRKWAFSAHVLSVTSWRFACGSVGQRLERFLIWLESASAGRNNGLIWCDYVTEEKSTKTHSRFIAAVRDWFLAELTGFSSMGWYLNKPSAGVTLGPGGWDWVLDPLSRLLTVVCFNIFYGELIEFMIWS